MDCVHLCTIVHRCTDELDVLVVAIDSCMYIRTVSLILYWTTILPIQDVPRSLHWEIQYNRYSMYMCTLPVQSNLISNHVYLKFHTQSLVLIRGIWYQY